jgi:hypothetical protein
MGQRDGFRIGRRDLVGFEISVHLHLQVEFTLLSQLHHRRPSEEFWSLQGHLRLLTARDHGVKSSGLREPGLAGSSGRPAVESNELGCVSRPNPLNVGHDAHPVPLAARGAAGPRGRLLTAAPPTAAKPRRGRKVGSQARAFNWTGHLPCRTYHGSSMLGHSLQPMVQTTGLDSRSVRMAFNRVSPAPVCRS